MASGKLSPRQKMINMMYLVLIALLALNVSKEILKAFYMFELSFNNANKNTDQKNADVIAAFQANMDDPMKKAKTEPWFILAKDAQKISKEYTEYIEKVKTEIVTKAGGRNEPKDGQVGLTELQQPDNLEKHANYFVVDEGGRRGKEVQEKMNSTRKKLIALLDKSATTKEGKLLQASLEKATQLRADDPKEGGASKHTWVSLNLEHSPLAGVVTFLTKSQNDCKSLEADVLNVLASNIDKKTLKFDKQMAVVISESTNVMSGSSFKAKVALAAYNSTAAQTILVNGSPVKVVDGLGEINIPASGVGSHTIVAKIQTLDPNTGETIYVEAPPVEYTTFQPSATISADAMNVLYIGLDNPMSISVPGVAPSATTVNPGPGLNLKKVSDGKYIATVAAGSRETSISVSAKMPDGTSKKMGDMKYRIKQVPRPVAQVGTLPAGSYAKGEIALQNTLYAYLENFVFEGVKYTVTKYRVIYMPKRGMMEEAPGVGNTTGPIRNFANKAKSGDLIVIDGIRANGPGVVDKPLNSIIYTIK